MTILGFYSVLGFLLILVSLLAPTSFSDPSQEIPDDFDRSYFPDDFIFGTASASYQYEGHANKSCRGPSVWDTFTHEFPERIADHSNGDVAVNFYEYYERDIEAMKSMSLDAFRFSISWTRLIPSGRLSEGFNQEGVHFYNKLIDEIIDNGMVPFATIFHFDAPQALEEKYGGFLCRCIVDDIRDFANLCFQHFGDRVKHWITLNEPWTYSSYGYDTGLFPPGRCSPWKNRACLAGDSATEPYIVAHHFLLAHAAIVQLYRQHYQEHQRGKIGVTLTSFWWEPYSNSTADQDAAKRAVDFMFGWFMEPITYGDYPRSMKTFVQDRLPKFECDEAELLKGSFDFLGLNYYSAYYAVNVDHVDPDRVSYSTDSHVHWTGERDGKLIGPPDAAVFYSYPPGMQYLLNYIKDTYKNPTIYITENGLASYYNGTGSWEETIDDTNRIEYIQDHLWNILESMKNHKVDVRGYFGWSFMDNFEWASGYSIRFGLWFVEPKTLKRIPRKSAAWFAEFLSPSSNPKTIRKALRQPKQLLNKAVN